MVQPEKYPLNFFENINKINQITSNKEVFIFLDYDGTLTPIVATPDLAVISDEMRETVLKLCRLCNVAIVSGRATDDVRSKVGIDNIFYAGSHGFEIVLPDGSIKVNEEAQAVKETMKNIYNELAETLKNVEGALVENVKYTISVHYRLVSRDEFSKVDNAVKNIVSRNNNLRITGGKKVFEIRPRIDWDKGKAVEWILKTLNFNFLKDTAIYIGDDTTDEDAFEVLKEKGFGILVSEIPKVSKADYYVKDTREVEEVLKHFINLKRN